MIIRRITTLPHPRTRPDDAHKGTFGRVLIVAGSPGMSGAAALSGLGALRGGAGLVYVASPSTTARLVATIEPSYLTIPLKENLRGEISAAALGQIQDQLKKMNAGAIGPGWGTTPSARKIVQELFESTSVPLLVDADGLNALAVKPECLGKHAAHRVLTPHPGEFARLIGSDIATVQKHREELALEFAAQRHVVLVLKGHGTVVTDGERLYVNTTGNSGMATGGTGDVLTGLITALLAQNFEPFAAAQLGVYLHGLAGDLAAEALSKPGLIASDLPRFLPHAWQQFLA
ncbi:NAD(P)H-hydrate dehydratase [Planctomicrobium sp. SH664]|uniref:NAD(P)H-hydrate dehydratase n=1 Tax=Planctomicrobium sp. SH664 TaxID=3448125 RepID=UPI003F5BD790